MLTLDQLNAALAATSSAALLDGVYEHSPWIAERALAQARRSPALRAAEARAGRRCVREAGARRAARADPRPPRARRQGDGQQDADRRIDQRAGQGGLTDCTPEEFATIQQLNADYNAKFGFPFILAVRGPRGTGLTQAARSSTTFERRLDNHPDFELAECLRNIHRIAEIRLERQVRRRADARQPGVGLGRAARAAQRPRLRRAGPAHRHLPHRRAPRLRAAAVALDARGLRLRRGGRSMRSATWSASTTAATPRRQARCSPASHYDTVRNGGKYDGRLGIFVPMACVRELQRARAGACRSASRWSASPRRKASATRRPSSARAR